MKTAIVKLVALTALAGTLGCQFHARSPEKYRADTRAVLETRSEQIRTCYDDVLKQNKAASGSVVGKFTVQNESGQFADVHVDETASTAPPEVQQCVTQAVSGLALAPPDPRDGVATFVYEFQAAGCRSPAGARTRTSTARANVQWALALCIFR
jgi:hypothetical protein